jgi:hypothetical protein
MRVAGKSDAGTSGEPAVGLLDAEVAFVLAEELTAGEWEVLPRRRRVRPEDVEAVLATQPIKVVLDRLEAHMGFDASHDWVMKPQATLDGLRPVEALARGWVREVLSAIETSFPSSA